MDELRARYLLEQDYAKLVADEEPLWQAAVDAELGRLAEEVAAFEAHNDTQVYRGAGGFVLVLGLLGTTFLGRRRAREVPTIGIRGAALVVDGRRIPWSSLKHVRYRKGRVEAELTDGTRVTTAPVRPSPELGRVLLFARGHEGEDGLDAEDRNRLQNLLQSTQTQNSS